MTTFPHKLVPLLDELAGAVLKQKMYGRLAMIAELLTFFVGDTWQSLDVDMKKEVVSRMRAGFHVRAWDDWEMSENSVYSQIHTIVDAEWRGLERQ